MRILTKKWQIILYGCAGLGLNMLNMIVGTYLCSALLVGGFDAHIESWTYLSKDLVVAGIWAVLILFVKAFDGIIDIPLSSLTDNLRTRWGRRRPAILMGLIPLLIAYVLFLFPLSSEAGILNTVWFGGLLAVFNGAYTLTMVTYYATFAELLKDDDVVYGSGVILNNTTSEMSCVIIINVFKGTQLVEAFAVEEKIFNAINRSQLQVNIENICHLLVGYRGNLSEYTDRNRCLYPTGDFDPERILWALKSDDRYREYLRSLDYMNAFPSDMQAAEVLCKLSYYQSETAPLWGAEAYQFAKNGEILKLLMRLDDLLAKHMTENGNQSSEDAWERWNQDDAAWAHTVPVMD